MEGGVPHTPFVRFYGNFFLPPAKEVCEGNVFTGVRSVHGGGGVHGQGPCMAGGHAWAGGMYGWRACMGRGMDEQGWACMAGGMCRRGHVWQGGMHGRGCAWQGGMHGRGHVWQGGVCDRGHVWWGVCMAGAYVAGGHAWQGGIHGRRDEHCSGWYASYWNAFLFQYRGTPHGETLHPCLSWIRYRSGSYRLHRNRNRNRTGNTTRNNGFQYII